MALSTLDKIQRIARAVFANSAILNNQILFKNDSLVEKFSDLADLINGSSSSIPLNSINEYDLDHYYRTSLDKLDLDLLKGRERRFEFGLAHSINTKICEDILDGLIQIKPEDYLIEFSIENFKGTFDLSTTQFDDINFTYQPDSLLLTISFEVKGYFDFEESDENKLLKFSAIESSVLILNTVFCYLSFYKDTIWTGAEFDYDQNLVLTIQKKNNLSAKKSVPFFVIDTLYLCYSQYRYRTYPKESVLHNFIPLIINKEPLYLAFDWFIQSRQANNIDHKIIMLCIAFEAMYGKDNLLTKGIKNKDTYILKLVYFLSESEQERKSYSSQLINLFNTRNSIVHADVTAKRTNKSKIYYDNSDIFAKAFLKEMTII